MFGIITHQVRLKKLTYIYLTVGANLVFAQIGQRQALPLHVLFTDNFIINSKIFQLLKQSPFPPPLEKGDGGGFEIATLPEFILSNAEGVARNDKRRL